MKPLTEFTLEKSMGNKKRGSCSYRSFITCSFRVFECCCCCVLKSGEDRDTRQSSTGKKGNKTALGTISTAFVSRGKIVPEFTMFLFRSCNKTQRILLVKSIKYPQKRKWSRTSEAAHTQPPLTLSLTDKAHVIEYVENQRV